jgi:CheY-like chemotaxis protein
MPTDRQFRRRILLVDSDTRFLHSCSETLKRQGYEVLTAPDGFAALCGLRGASPDLLITELNLRRMSGFELLSIVRTRFPMIAVIAVSSDYSAGTMPREVICDAFFAKGPNLEFELLEEVRNLISESPLRGSRAKSDKAPVWIPRSNMGYIVLTCPECLRSFSVAQPKQSAANETCVCCGADVPFEMSSVEVPPAPPPQTPGQRSHTIRVKSQQLRAESRQFRDKPPS